MRASETAPIRPQSRWTAVFVATALLVAAVVRLPGLGSQSLSSVEQAVFAESQGFDSRAGIPPGEPVAAHTLRHAARPAPLASSADALPLRTAALFGWTRIAGSSESSLRLASALAGALTAALAAIVGAQIAGAWGAAWTGLLVALSPIHVLASREVSPSAPFLLGLVVSLVLLLHLEDGAGDFAAAAHGLLLGALAASGALGLVSLAVLQVVWLAWHAERRRAVVVSGVAALLVLALAGAVGLFRSPLGPIEGSDWVPHTTLPGLVRCAGASLTRLAGLEFHLIVPHARHVLPLTLGVLTLAALGARSTPPRLRWLLASGTALPFALGAVLALSTGRVTPLQAARLVDALPFLAALTGAGIASLVARTAALAGSAVATGLLTFLALALTAHSTPSSPRQATAEVVSRCLRPGVTVTVRRSLDAVVLAAWRVPGPFALSAVGPPADTEPTIRVSATSVCAAGVAPSCPEVPACAAD